MPHLSLYRKYRSQTFGDLIGQDHVVRTLQNSIASGRIAHAYLFTGPRGTGKTSSARLFAKALVCEKGPLAEPCNECDLCVAVTIGNCMDVYEMDAASESGVDQVREAIVDVAEYKPTTARYKIFIIDEVHDLSGKAFDALLKTIEEPPSHVVFILATTEYNKVPPTIRSRCQKFEFHRGTLSDLTKRLEYVVAEEHAEAEPAALAAIARMADGAYRDALTLLEQALVTADGPITLKHVYDQLGLIPEELVDGLLTAMKECEPQNIMRLTEEAWRLGRDPRSVLESMEYRLGDLTRAAYGVDLGTTDATREASLHEAAARIGKDTLLALRASIAEAHKSIRDVSLPRLWLEAELIRIARQFTAPVAVAPQPRAEKASDRPKPAEAVVAPTAAKPAPEAKTQAVASVAETESTGNPELDAARQLWAKALAELPETAPISFKLNGSKVARAKGTDWEVQMLRTMDAEWMTEKPQRHGHIVSILKKLSGQEYRVTYSANKNGEAHRQPEAVELPAEGQRLEQLAKDILGAS
ncbi:MAG: polymerase subunit gamma/tau [Fimbriimonadaceae bacterium]|nr:polymerase subunit gamma/tau [Fimbriimonadaceae bacterium]